PGRCTKTPNFIDGFVGELSLRLSLALNSLWVLVKMMNVPTYYLLRMRVSSVPPPERFQAMLNGVRLILQVRFISEITKSRVRLVAVFVIYFFAARRSQKRSCNENVNGEFCRHAISTELNLRVSFSKPRPQNAP